MKKCYNRVCTLILSLLLLIPTSTSAVAEESVDSFDYVGVLVSDGVTTKLREAILRNDDIFFPAELYGTLAGCEITEGIGKYGYKIGQKYIIVDCDTGKMNIQTLNYSAINEQNCRIAQIQAAQASTSDKGI